MAEIVTEQQKTPETLTEIMDDVRPVYSGHPASEESAEEKLDETIPLVKESDTEVKELEPAAQEEQESKPDEPVFKYKSHEEAEKGYREAEKLISQSTESTKRERERSEDLQGQLNEALLKTDTQEKSEEETPPVRTTTNAERMQKLLEEVNRLDPEDNDYNLKVAEVWGRLDDERQAEFQTAMQATLDRYDQQKQDDWKRIDDEKTVQDKIVSDAAGAATSEGLDMSEGSSDAEMFWAFANMAPEGSLEDQTKWTIDKVKTLRKPVVVDKEKTREVQEQNAVLERAGEKPPEKRESVRPLTLGDAFGQTERRI